MYIQAAKTDTVKINLTNIQRADRGQPGAFMVSLMDIYLPHGFARANEPHSRGFATKRSARPLTPSDWAAAERSKPVHGRSRGWASAIRATTFLRPRQRHSPMSTGSGNDQARINLICHRFGASHYPARPMAESIVAGERHEVS